MTNKTERMDIVSQMTNQLSDSITSLQILHAQNRYLSQLFRWMFENIFSSSTHLQEERDSAFSLVIDLFQRAVQGFVHCSRGKIHRLLTVHRAALEFEAVDRDIQNCVRSRFSPIFPQGFPDYLKVLKIAANEETEKEVENVRTLIASQPIKLETNPGQVVRNLLANGTVTHDDVRIHPL